MHCLALESTLADQDLPYYLSNPYGAYLMHQQHLLAVGDGLWRHVPADCGQRSETARIGSFLYLLKLPISPWSDEHSSGHRCIITDPDPCGLWLSAPAVDGQCGLRRGAFPR